MSKRTQVLAQIATAEKRLKYQRNRVAKHKKYLIAEVKAHWVALTLTLLPALYVILRAGKKRGVGHTIKRFMRIGFMAYTSHVKKLLFNF